MLYALVVTYDMLRCLINRFIIIITQSIQYLFITWFVTLCLLKLKINEVIVRDTYST